jgi:hypothetical protein
MARALTEAFRGIYSVLQQLGQRRTVVPLIEDIDAREGQVIVGVADGQVIRLPEGIDGSLGQVGIVLTDVVNPITVLNPDGTATSLGQPGAYDFITGTPDVYQTNPGGTVIGGSIPTDRLVGRDSPGTGAAQFISLTGGLEFSGSQSIRIADNGVTNAKLRDSSALSVIGRASNTSGDPADISATGARQFLGTNTAGTAVSFQTLSLLSPGAPIYDVMAAPFNASGSLAADDTAALNAAIAAANAVPGRIYLGPSHRITGALTPITGHNIIIQGRGEFNVGTWLVIDSAAPINLFTLSSQYCGINDVWITSARVYSAGLGIDVLNAYNARINRVRIQGTFEGIRVANSVLTYIDQCDVSSTWGPRCYFAEGVSGGLCHEAIFHRCQAGGGYPLAEAGSPSDWAPSTAYVVGNIVIANGNIYQCVVSGTSAGAGTGPSGIPGIGTPDSAYATHIVDGTAEWLFAMPHFSGFMHGSNVHTFQLNHCTVLNGGYGLSVEDHLPGGEIPQFTRTVNFQADHMLTRGVRLLGGHKARLHHTFVTSISAGSGIEIASTYGGDWEFVGGEVFGCSEAGVIIDCGNGALADIQIGACGGASPDTRDGIEVGNSASDWSVTGCSSGVMFTGTTYTRYGISVGSGCDNYLVVGNRFVDNLTGAILNTPGVALSRVVRSNVPDDGNWDGILVTANGGVGSKWLSFDFDDTSTIDFSFADNGGQDLNIRADWLGILVTANGVPGTRWLSLDFDDSATIDFSFADNGGQDLNVSAAVIDDSITNTKLANMASPRLKGRTTSGTGDPEDLTVTNSTTVTWNTATGGAISTERAALTGDVTASANSNATTIANNAVTNAKAADMATQTFKGRTTAGTGDPEDLSAAQAAGILVGQFPPNNAEFVTYSANATLTAERVTTSSTTVTVSTSVAGQIEFQRTALTGDVTASANSNATTIANDAVTNAKLANMAAGRVKGVQVDGSTGDPQDLTGLEVGELVRAQENQNWVSLAAGDYTGWAISSIQHIVAVDPNAGDVNIHGFTVSGGNAGGWFRIVKRGSDGRVLIKHQSGTEGTATNRTICPGAVDYVLTADGDAVDVHYIDNSIATSGTPGSVARWQVMDRAYVGTTSEINLTSISGNQGTVNIASLECGGCVNVSATADWQIEGFTAKADGFWFILSANNANFVGTLFDDDATATAADRMRNTHEVDLQAIAIQAFIYYAESRWRVVCTGRVSNVQLSNMAGNTIKANATASTGDPQDLAISADSFPARLSGNLVSHSLATLAGSGLDYASGGIINVAVDNDRDIQIDGSTGALFFRKSRRRHQWWEDFTHVPAQNITTAGAYLSFGQTGWFGDATGATGTLTAPLAEDNHPGIANIATGTTSTNAVSLNHGLIDLGGSVLAQDVYMVEAIFRLPTVTSILWEFGLRDQPGDNFVEFFGDTAVGTTTRTYVEEATVSTTTDTGTTYSAGAWNVYTLIQETLGTFDFYIDDVLEDTRSSNIPDAEEVYVFFEVTTRTAAARSIDIDYVYFESKNLGARTS